MYRMVVRELAGPAALEREELSEVQAGPGEVVIDVKAVGCNFFDTLITEGKYQVKPELPFSPGAEVAGIVRTLGPGVSRFSVGDRVSALLEYGGYTSIVAAPEPRVFPITNEMRFEEAAALGLVYQTSYVGLAHRANLKKGETLLVHAAAGGVGLAAVQLGVALGAKVIGTAGTEEKLALVKANGAHEAINYREEDWVGRVKELTSGRGADVVYDPVGGDTFDLSTKCIAFEGRILIIGFASGKIPSAKMNRVLVKNFSLIGLHWGLYFKMNPGVIQHAQEAIVRLHAEGKIAPLVSATYPLSEAEAALAELGGRKTTGKVVLIP
ncbi:MAG: NADPH:quinone oxidoreductase family protein [Deltaproteobacteria bacterium]|nr:NADPH:quinone oxidoreductase family protein [Deltaproteobacteria bacterium]NND28024.1 NADPH:quinone oxidoreductase family protein [Myxococcales bacterium]MBT8467026.1 NADPH:quinone oxidoreductase family protein [Deltaproteobacteria bacterium]MBT8483879.1 NADPH:quinone oxidoreductase family protein [Deltaproteobacteria bacterium]NNK06401.1 NADPH:quinone oxidoreductase family protein [Myxococcales bacterium]